ncbi:lipopolysaccharide assembly protein LapB [Psychrobacillus sp. OK032]|uniref:tetratricopeptide repeat protein n=1 Tax=Psychrobacillus sp. OK032 TaxID=1884358 RepID=UPI0008D5A1CE|nr:tetratricopeptide repeat protein [Psychrobacillus sp. OK032]SER84573.1 Tetratricopeptide repeat-containing protein [Psychrobacillus sp. OK032]
MNYNELGIQAIQEENYEKAVELFTKAIEENPDEAIGYINFGNLLASMNENDRAERFFQKAITLDEHAATAFYSLANLYYNTDRFEEAAKLYEKAISNGIEGADAYFMLGKSFEKEGHTKLSLPYLQRAFELAPEDIQIALSYGIALASMEMFEQAEPLFKEILALEAENADAHYNLGVLYAVSTSDTDAALHHLKEAFTIQPTYDQARYVYDMISLRN